MLSVQGCQPDDTGLSIELWRYLPLIQKEFYGERICYLNTGKFRDLQRPEGNFKNIVFSNTFTVFVHVIGQAERE